MAQSTVDFQDISIPKALQIAKEQNKPLFVFCYAEWCPHCKKMRQYLFTQTDVVQFLNTHFVCVEKDMEKGEGIKVHDWLGVSGLPTYSFVKYDSALLYQITGEYQPVDFIVELQNALTPNLQLPFLKQKFEKNVSNSLSCYYYLKALKKAGLKYNEVVETYFKTQTDSQLLNELNWKIFTNGIDDMDSRIYRYVLAHKNDFSALTSLERVDRKLTFTAKEQLGKYAYTFDTANYYKYRKIASQLHIFTIDSLIFKFDLLVGAQTKNWGLYKTAVVTGVEKFAWNDNSALSGIIDNYLKNINDKTSLMQTSIWAEHLLSLAPSYQDYLNCARVFQKTGNIPKAIQAAQKAKDFQIEWNGDFSEADKLLKEMK